MCSRLLTKAHLRRCLVCFVGVLFWGLLGGNVGLSAESLPPKVYSDPGYLRLHKALVDYQHMVKKDGWPAMTLPAGGKLEPGDRSPMIETLRQRLLITGDLKKERVKEPGFYDEQLQEAVKRFQSRHGLNEDGRIGKETLVALNVPLETRIHQIEKALERWGEGPPWPEETYLAVNIPAYAVAYFQEGQVKFESRVIVGMKNWPTPILNATLTHVVFNPKWHVPQKIAVKEVIPDIRKDAEYLGKKRMRVFATGEGKTEEIDPETVDWNDPNLDARRYVFRQDSGDANALGRIKFLFPNPYDVYLHDTPNRSFFQRDFRALSHGCIRVERPLDLAGLVFSREADWPMKKIEGAIARGQEQFVKLSNPIPVHLYYRTAWVDEKGRVQFRQDIYGRDKKDIGTH